jgi:hypothetical protein
MIEIKTPLPLREDEKVTLPARQQIVADLKWIKAITIVCPSPTEEGRVQIEYVPMTRNGQLILKDDAGQNTTRTVGTESLYSDKEQVPELAAAFTAFLACIGPMERFDLERSGQFENSQND